MAYTELLLFSILAVFVHDVFTMSVPLTSILKKEPTRACIRSCRETKHYGVKDYNCGFSCIKIVGKTTNSERVKRRASIPRSWRGVCIYVSFYLLFNSKKKKNTHSPKYTAYSIFD